MLNNSLIELAESATTIGGRPVILPGQQEPEWLRRSAEHARELPLLLAEQRAARGARHEVERAGLIYRLRLAISRE